MLKSGGAEIFKKGISGFLAFLLIFYSVPLPSSYGMPSADQLISPVDEPPERTPGEEISNNEENQFPPDSINPEENVLSNPTYEPSPEPSAEPSAEPNPFPSAEPSFEPVPYPSPVSSEQPSPEPSVEPSPNPYPSEEPSAEPSPYPSPVSSEQPSPEPSVEPSPNPYPSEEPSAEPSPYPSPVPSEQPSPEPSMEPSPMPDPELDPMPLPPGTGYDVSGTEIVSGDFRFTGGIAPGVSFSSVDDLSAQGEQTFIHYFDQGQSVLDLYSNPAAYGYTYTDSLPYPLQGIRGYQKFNNGKYSMFTLPGDPLPAGMQQIIGPEIPVDQVSYVFLTYQHGSTGGGMTVGRSGAFSPPTEPVDPVNFDGPDDPENSDNYNISQVAGPNLGLVFWTGGLPQESIHYIGTNTYGETYVRPEWGVWNTRSSSYDSSIIEKGAAPGNGGMFAISSNSRYSAIFAGWTSTTTHLPLKVHFEVWDAETQSLQVVPGDWLNGYGGSNLASISMTDDGKVAALEYTETGVLLSIYNPATGAVSRFDYPVSRESGISLTRVSVVGHTAALYGMGETASILILKLNSDMSAVDTSIPAKGYSIENQLEYFDALGRRLFIAASAIELSEGGDESELNFFISSPATGGKRVTIKNGLADVTWTGFGILSNMDPGGSARRWSHDTGNEVLAFVAKNDQNWWPPYAMRFPDGGGQPLVGELTSLFNRAIGVTNGQYTLWSSEVSGDGNEVFLSFGHFHNTSPTSYTNYILRISKDELYGSVDFQPAPGFFSREGLEPGAGGWTGSEGSGSGPSNPVPTPGPTPNPPQNPNPGNPSNPTDPAEESIEIQELGPLGPITDLDPAYINTKAPIAWNGGTYRLPDGRTFMVGRQNDTWWRTPSTGREYAYAAILNPDGTVAKMLFEGLSDYQPAADAGAAHYLVSQGSVSPDGRFVAFKTEEKEIDLFRLYVYDTQTGRMMSRNLEMSAEDRNGDVSSINFELAAAVDNEGNAYLLADIDGHERGIVRFNFSGQQIGEYTRIDSRMTRLTMYDSNTLIAYNDTAYTGVSYTGGNADLQPITVGAQLTFQNAITLPVRGYSSHLELIPGNKFAVRFYSGGREFVNPLTGEIVNGASVPPQGLGFPVHSALPTHTDEDELRNLQLTLWHKESGNGVTGFININELYIQDTLSGTSFGPFDMNRFISEMGGNVNGDSGRIYIWSFTVGKGRISISSASSGAGYSTAFIDMSLEEFYAKIGFTAPDPAPVNPEPEPEPEPEPVNPEPEPEPVGPQPIFNYKLSEVPGPNSGLIFWTDGLSEESIHYIGQNRYGETDVRPEWGVWNTDTHSYDSTIIDRGGSPLKGEMFAISSNSRYSAIFAGRTSNTSSLPLEVHFEIWDAETQSMKIVSGKWLSGYGGSSILSISMTDDGKLVVLERSGTGGLLINIYNPATGAVSRLDYPISGTDSGVLSRVSVVGHTVAVYGMGELARILIFKLNSDMSAIDNSIPAKGYGIENQLVFTDSSGRAISYAPSSLELSEGGNENELNFFISSPGTGSKRITIVNGAANVTWTDFGSLGNMDPGGSARRWSHDTGSEVLAFVAKNDQSWWPPYAMRFPDGGGQPVVGALSPLFDRVLGITGGYYTLWSSEVSGDGSDIYLNFGHFHNTSPTTYSDYILRISKDELNRSVNFQPASGVMNRAGLNWDLGSISGTSIQGPAGTPAIPVPPPGTPPNPVDPDPVDPVVPQNPTNPVDPKNPTDPVDPEDPSTPINPIDPGERGIKIVELGPLDPLGDLDPLYVNMHAPVSYNGGTSRLPGGRTFMVGRQNDTWWRTPSTGREYAYAAILNPDGTVAQMLFEGLSDYQPATDAGRKHYLMSQGNISPDGRFVAFKVQETETDAVKLYVYDTETGRMMSRGLHIRAKNMYGDEFPVTYDSAIAVDNEGNTYLLGAMINNGKGISRFSFSGQQIGEFKPVDAQIKSLSMYDADTLVAYGDATLRSYDVSNQQFGQLRTVNVPAHGYVSHIELIPGNEFAVRFYSGGRDFIHPLTGKIVNGESIAPQGFPGHSLMPTHTDEDETRNLQFTLWHKEVAGAGGRTLNANELYIQDTVTDTNYGPFDMNKFISQLGGNPNGSTGRIYIWSFTIGGGRISLSTASAGAGYGSAFIDMKLEDFYEKIGFDAPAPMAGLDSGGGSRGMAEGMISAGAFVEPLNFGTAAVQQTVFLNPNPVSPRNSETAAPILPAPPRTLSAAPVTVQAPITPAENNLVSSPVSLTSAETQPVLAPVILDAQPEILSPRMLGGSYGWSQDLTRDAFGGLMDLNPMFFGISTEVLGEMGPIQNLLGFKSAQFAGRNLYPAEEIKNLNSKNSGSIFQRGNSGPTRVSSNPSDETDYSKQTALQKLLNRIKRNPS